MQQLNDVELKFGDVCVNSEKSLTITLINNSDNHYRFNFVNNLEPSLIFYPTFGFLLAHTQKEIEVKFFSKESVKHILKDLFVELKQFNFVQAIKLDDDYRDYYDGKLGLGYKSENDDFNFINRLKKN